MSTMVIGSDNLLYIFNPITKVMEGYDPTDGSLDNTFSFAGKTQDFATDGTLIFIHNPLTGQCEGWEPVGGTLDESFDVDWTEGTPITVDPTLAQALIVYGYNELTGEVVGYTISTGAEATRAVVGANPLGTR